jgi:folate-binding protein YgfZ
MSSQMPSKTNPSLPFRLSSVAVSGPDATGFLQSQLTANMDRLEPGTWTPAAWCNPKGRAIAVMRVMQDGETVHLALPSTLADEIVKRLNLYRIGRKVTISAGPKVEPNENGDLELTETPASPERVHRWLAGEIARGMPWLLTETIDRFLPQMLGLERIGGLSYRKGCYPGQEIVARVHYRGRLTQHLARFESDATPPQPGTSITLPPGTCTVLYAVENNAPDSGSTGLMVIPVNDEISDAGSGFWDGLRMNWVVVDADHAVLPSGA